MVSPAWALCPPSSPRKAKEPVPAMTAAATVAPVNSSPSSASWSPSTRRRCRPKKAKRKPPRRPKRRKRPPAKALKAPKARAKGRKADEARGQVQERRDRRDALVGCRRLRFLDLGAEPEARRSNQ